MITKYRTGYGAWIEEIEIERETEHSVWIGGCRYKKITNYYQYHDSYDLAFEYLRKSYYKKLVAANLQLESAQKDHREVLKLKPKF